ncbi:hypothetical protein SAMN03159338_1608 [Sphingomonas sp. NFR04]|uniref:hypothetical protein n=1 Tax=Sphingomonas sp. NFR04 TaxID=1566283 RepID=UPI0008EEF493|nr:hypothetical protein [Sphingomonas sp. NFR04]SFJ50913.1 hypothetical protein SAMN03159338_1608 [Sphingomonas sp. NFR04]
MDEEEQRLAAEAAAREAAEAAAAEAARRPAGGNAGDEAAAELERVRAELAEARTAAARFEGIDPEAARANATRVAELDRAARDAEAERARAEGNFERLRELQNEEHQAQLTAAQAERDNLRTEHAQAIADAALARRQVAFATSKFFAAETILTPAKAERLYGDYVEIENRVPVVYDKPKGAAGRAMVMDAKGKPLSFDDAMKKVVDGEPDKDTFLKSKITPGAGSRTMEGKSGDKPVDRHTKLSMGLKALREAR